MCDVSKGGGGSSEKRTCDVSRGHYRYMRPPLQETSKFCEPIYYYPTKK